MKSVLLYYPFEIAENANSGSKLRPKEMYKAFQEWGAKENIEILLLSGNSSARETLFEQWKAEGKLENVWFCYMENQTIPFWLTDKGHIPKKPLIDKKVLSYLKQRHVPVGVFYRDVYWKFDELYPLKGVKKTVMQTIYRMEERFYNKYCQVIFLPSDAMGKYVDIQREKISLPPGGKKVDVVKKEKDTQFAQGLYVGGINNEDYGLFLLLDALEIANKQEKVSELTIVCREDEYKQLPEEKKARLQEMDVTIQHVSGEALNDLYREMDFAFIPRYRSTYNDFAVPVKLVEYLSNELPVIATYCQAQREIIESDGYGIICEDKPEDMARAIKEMALKATGYRENIQNTFLQKHSWTARVEKIKNALVKE
ncbi:glycosyltransferase [Bacillus sp. JJ1503]|uniref:glycosyltransferase n=1 Tax=Bacillus sp. JJ1503 TaxID=3122956 RepID=UPI002FFD9EC0